MFDREIRGQLAMLMGGRAAEEVSCDAVSTGAVDDIRRATDLAYKAVSGARSALLPWYGVVKGVHTRGSWPARARPDPRPRPRPRALSTPAAPAPTAPPTGAEYGLSASIGPLSVGTLISGGDDYAMLKDSGSPVAR